MVPRWPGPASSSCPLQDLSPGQARLLEREVCRPDTGLSRRGILDHVREVRHGVSESVLDRTKVERHVRDILDRVTQHGQCLSRTSEVAADNPTQTPQHRPARSSGRWHHQPKVVSPTLFSINPISLPIVSANSTEIGLRLFDCRRIAALSV